MRDIEEGCAEAVQQIERWTRALMAGNFETLEEVLASDFQFTVEPRFGGGRMDKQQFIAFDRKIRNCQIDLQRIVARKMGNLVTMLIMAQVDEEFGEDLGPGMPSREEMIRTMKGATLAYASGWRQEEDAQWRCFSHHIFGFVGS